MLLNSLISTHKALIEKMATKSRTETFPHIKTFEYANYENKIIVINISIEHYSAISILYRQKHSFLENQGCNNKIITNIQSQKS